MSPGHLARSGVRLLGFLAVLIGIIYCVYLLILIFQIRSYDESGIHPEGPGVGSTDLMDSPLLWMLVFPASIFLMGVMLSAASSVLGRWIASGADEGVVPARTLVFVRLCAVAIVGFGVVFVAVSLAIPKSDEHLHDTYYVIGTTYEGYYGSMRGLIPAAIGVLLLALSRPIARWIGAEPGADA